MQPETFILLIFFYQFILAGRDFVVTGILAQGLPADWRFHTYAVVTTLEVSVLAALAFLTEPSTTMALLKAWTVYLCWFGGFLDWIYFGIRKLVYNKEPPEWNFVWFWMPKIVVKVTKGKIEFDHPTTAHWALWTMFMWMPNMMIWGFTLM